MKNVLILGSSGFIGKNLTEQLSSRYKVFAPKRDELDLTDSEAVDAYFRQASIDTVINCTIVGGARPDMKDGVLSDNLRIFFNLLRNKKRYKKMIHLGSGAEYDKQRPIVRVAETDCGGGIPQSHYCLYKYICSQCIEKESNIVSLRIFGLFGKYEDHRYRFISHAIVNTLHEKPITIKQNVYFDYVYIDDFTRIVMYFIDHESKEKFFNIGSGKRIDLVTLAGIVNDVGKRKSGIRVFKKGLGNEYTCDNTRLMRYMKGFRFSDMKESIEKLYRWYESNLYKNIRK